MSEVTNTNKTVINFKAAIQLMDDEIREELHNSKKWANEQEFFTAYEKAHAEKYGEWELSKAKPTW